MRWHTVSYSPFRKIWRRTTPIVVVGLFAVEIFVFKLVPALKTQVLIFALCHLDPAARAKKSHSPYIHSLPHLLPPVYLSCNQSDHFSFVTAINGGNTPALSCQRTKKISNVPVRASLSQTIQISMIRFLAHILVRDSLQLQQDWLRFAD